MRFLRLAGQALCLSGNFQSRAFFRRTLTALTMVLVWTAAAHASGHGAPSVNVVLVHGFLDNGHKFDPLVRRLTHAGYHCFAPTLRPNDGSTGIRDLTTKLSAQIDAHFGAHAPFFLIGFSMGGIVARDYVENTPGRRRVRGVFLISTGSRGTLWACLAPGGHLRELAIGSPFLQGLNDDDSAWQTVPIHAYWTPLDLMIVPSVNTRWPEGKTTRVVCPLHPWMPGNRVVIADILARLKSLSIQDAGNVLHQ